MRNNNASLIGMVIGFASGYLLVRYWRLVLAALVTGLAVVVGVNVWMIAAVTAVILVLARATD